MKDISLHLLDIFENSAKAGATLVSIGIRWHGTTLEIRISDNGPGFPDSVRNDPVNPYSTTRTERKVGLGLSLLEEAARQTGGHMILGKSELGGVLVESVFMLEHPDAKPVGDIAGVISTSIAAWPSLDWIVTAEGVTTEILDTRDIRKELDDIPLQEPEVLKFIERQIGEMLSPMGKWASSIAPNFKLIV